MSKLQLIATALASDRSVNSAATNYDTADQNLDTATGTDASVVTNAAAAMAQIGAFTGVSVGSESSDVCAFGWTCVDSNGDAVDETKSFTVMVLNNADDALQAVTAYAIAATTGTVAAVDDGTYAIYTCTTNAAGVFAGTITDVVGGTSITTKFVTSCSDGNGVYYAAGPTLSNITWDGA